LIPLELKQPPAPELASAAEVAIPPMPWRAPANWPVAAGAVMAGLAASWQFCGAQSVFAAHIDPLPATAAMVTIVALLFIVAGVRAGKWVLEIIRQTCNRSPAVAARSERATATDNLPALLTTALISATGGFLALACVAGSGPVLRVYHRLLGQFFWTNLTLAGLEWFVVAALMAGPCATLGILLVSLEKVGRSNDASRHVLFPLSAGLLGGASLALGARAILPTSISAEQHIVLGTLPLFVLAAMGVLLSHRTAGQSDATQVNEPRSMTPAQPDAALLQLAPFLWALSITVACTGWLSCRTSPVAGSGSHAAELARAGLFGGIALGYVVSAAFAVFRVRPTLPCGPAAWLCGLGAGLAASLQIWLPHRSLHVVLQLAVLSLPIGFGLHTLGDSWAARISPAKAGCRRVNTCVLAGIAVGLAASHWWGLPYLGAMGTLAAGSTLLLAIGGLLELHEALSRSHLLRLATVFGSLAAAILLYPSHTRAWSRLEQRLTTASTVSSSVLFEVLSEIRTACLINVPPATVESLPAGRTTHIEILPLSSWRWGWPQRRDQAGRIHVVSMPAPRALRLSHSRYQLIYQSVRAGRDDAAVYCSAEWLSQLGRHLTAGGTLVLDLPLVEMDEQDILDHAATFQHAAAGSCWWSVINTNEPRLLLRSGPAPAGKRSSEAAAWHALDELLDRGSPSAARVLSIRQGNARRDQKSAPDLNSTLDWLAERPGTAASVARAATPPRRPQ
jgi:hypothetical protein